MAIQTFNEFVSLHEKQPTDPGTVSRGVQFEWAIVYAALKKAKAPTLAAKLKKYPQLNVADSAIKQDAEYAVMNVPEKLLPLAQHSDEANVGGAPEPKTDILFGEKVRVSVKMSGPIQLSSAEGKTTASMMKKLMEDTVTKNPEQREKLLKRVVARIEKMPTKMISPQNFDRLKAEAPDKIIGMVKRGKILDEFNWETWEAENRLYIKRGIAKALKEDEAFAFALTEEALTGKKQFPDKPLAVATHIITPHYFRRIDKDYITGLMKHTTIDVRAKSRKGITSATIRFDVKEEFTRIAVAEMRQLNEFTFDDMIDGMQKLGAKASAYIGKWWKQLKARLVKFYTDHFDQLLDESIADIVIVVNTVI